MRVLVTGGAGYIGSHAVRHLLDAGHEVTALDDLSSGHAEAVDPRARFVKGSAGDGEAVAGLLASAGIEAVMHFAARIEVAESVRDPQRYYRNNFVHTLELLHAMRITGVRRFVFSSTAAVYGEARRVPIEESAPLRPINPYGRSKLMVEWALRDFSTAYGLGFAVLRYFNVAGASPDGRIGEDHRPETHLIPRILEAALTGEPVRVFGADYPTRDGTCVRDYVHVADLVRAHRLALERLVPGEGQVFNLGSETGFTVREVIAACEQVTGRTLKVSEEARRPGDPPTLVASSRRIRRLLGWEPEYPELAMIVAHSWRWHQTHPHGYGTEKRRLA